jgi:hypothetical protein
MLEPIPVIAFVTVKAAFKQPELFKKHLLTSNDWLNIFFCIKVLSLTYGANHWAERYYSQ